MAYGDIFAISLYRVIGRIRMMTLHLGVLNEESDMGGRTWDRVRDVLAKIRCPHDLEVGTYMRTALRICVQNRFGLLFMMWGDVI